MSEEGEGDNTNPPVHSNRDEVLRKKDFGRVKGLDISSFMVSNDEAKTSPVVSPQSEPIVETKETVEEDIAVGQMTEIFSRDDSLSNQAGQIQKDGTVVEPSDLDSVTDMAVHGEKQLSKGLMVAMIVIWTMIGTLIGTNPSS